MADPGSFKVRSVNPVQIAPMAGTMFYGANSCPISFPTTGGITGVGEARLEGHLYHQFLPVLSFNDEINVGTKLQKVVSKPSSYTVEHPQWGYHYGYKVTGDLARMTIYSVYIKQYQENGLIADSSDAGSYANRWLPFGPPFDENRRNRSLLRAYAKLNAAEIQGSVDLAESSETLQMLRLGKLFKLLKSPLNTLGSALKDFRKEAHRYRRLPKHRKIMSPAEAASNVWMEYRYGVRPFMGQVQQYRDMILGGFIKYVNGRHRASATEVWEWVQPTFSETKSYSFWNSSCGSDYMTIESGWTDKGKDKYTTQVYYKVTHLSEAEKIRLSLGLTLGDLPMHLWETIPLSFCADWLFDVGLWLSAWKPKPGRSIECVIRSSKREAERLFYAKSSYLMPATKITCHEPGELTAKTLYREAAPSLPLLPTINPALLDVARKADSTAIVFQRIAQPIKALLGRKR